MRLANVAVCVAFAGTILLGGCGQGSSTSVESSATPLSYDGYVVSTLQSEIAFIEATAALRQSIRSDSDPANQAASLRDFQRVIEEQLRLAKSLTPPAELEAYHEGTLARLQDGADRMEEVGDLINSLATAIEGEDFETTRSVLDEMYELLGDLETQDDQREALAITALEARESDPLAKYLLDLREQSPGDSASAAVCSGPDFIQEAAQGDPGFLGKLAGCLEGALAEAKVAHGSWNEIIPPPEASEYHSEVAAIIAASAPRFETSYPRSEMEVWRTSNLRRISRLPGFERSLAGTSSPSWLSHARSNDGCGIIVAPKLTLTYASEVRHTVTATVRRRRMDFRFTPEQESFREEVRGFLREELPPNWEGIGAYGEGADEESGVSVRELGRRMARKLAERNWLAMAWPVEYGGLGAPHMQQLIYNEEMSYHGAPGGFSMGVAWVGPAMMIYGTDEQKERYLPRITSGEDVWCTLYSEPGAGSDLAALQTRAVEDGDDFVINGQKIWTSGAQFSQWGWLAARTDPEAPKHKGISTFVVPMDAPGVTIRPLVNMAGQAGFSEVFFDNVRIPKDYLVGELNRGWYQVAVALDFERSGIQAYAGGRRTLERLVSYVREQPEGVRNNPSLRMRLADRAVELAAGTNIAYRIPWMQSQGKIPNHEASVSKLFGSELTQRLASTGLQLLGLYGGLEPGSKWAPLKGMLERTYLSAVASTIAAGTSEVQRGIIAMRGLGLPRG